MATIITLSSDQVVLACSLAEKGSTKAEIADRLSISRTTLYNIFDRDPVFKALLDQSYAKLNISIREALMTLVTAGDVRAIIHASKSILGNTEKKQVDHTVVGGTEMSDEQLKAYALNILGLTEDDLPLGDE